MAQVISDSGQRKMLLEKTDFTAGDNVLDVPNGYLRIDIPIRLEGDGEGEPRRRRIVVTYFAVPEGQSILSHLLRDGDPGRRPS